MTETIEPEVLTPEIIPIVELEKINATDAGFLKLSTKIDDYIASGNQDKTANELTLLCVKIRTDSDKIARQLAKPYGDKYDEIIAYGKSIGARAKALEDKVRPIKDAYEAEIERIKKEKQEAEARKIADRINSLYAIGATLKDNSYFIQDVVIDAIEVKASPDEEWNVLYAAAELAYTNEQTRLSEEKRIRDEEADRIATEQEEERKRQEQVRVDQLAAQKLIEEQQAQLKQQLEQFAKQKLELRQNRLKAFGLTFSELGFFMLNGGFLSWANLSDMPDEAFEEYILDLEVEAQASKKRSELLTTRIERMESIGYVRQEDFSLRLVDVKWSSDSIADMTEGSFEELIRQSILANERRAEEEVERQKQEVETALFNLRLPQLLAVGFMMDGDAEMYRSSWSVVTAEDICTIPDDAFDAILERAEAENKADQKAADDAKKKADKERTTRLKSDKDALVKFFMQVKLANSKIKLTEPESIDLHDSFYVRFGALVSEYLTASEAL